MNKNLKPTPISRNIAVWSKTDTSLKLYITVIFVYFDVKNLFKYTITEGVWCSKRDKMNEASYDPTSVSPKNLFILNDRQVVGNEKATTHVSNQEAFCISYRLGSSIACQLVISMA